MKKIKYFFLRQYSKIIRFLITFSSVIALIFAQTFSASAVTYIDCVYAPPTLTGNNCYAEIVTSNNWHWLVYVEVTSLNSPSVVGEVSFRAFIGDTNYLRISADVSSVPSAYIMHGYYVDMASGNMVMFETYNDTTVQTWIKSAGTITGFHGYNCRVGIPSATKNDFVINYGTDISFRSSLNSIAGYVSQININVMDIESILRSINTNIVNLFNQNRAFFGTTNMDQILKAIQDNKSSAENNAYTSPDTSNASQYESAESQLMDTTASGRSSAVDTMKGIGSILDNHVGKSLVATSKLMSEFLGIDWLGDIVHFALVCGLFAFVLGISVLIIGSFGNWHVASRHADVDYNSHRKRLGK